MRRDVRLVIALRNKGLVKNVKVGVPLPTVTVINAWKTQNNK